MLDENVNKNFERDFALTTDSKSRGDKLSSVSNVKLNKTRQFFDGDKKYSQNLSPQNITNTHTISFSLENLPNNKDNNLTEDISEPLREEGQLTSEELDKINELKEIMDYKDFHLRLKEDDICNLKNNSHVNENICLNDDYNLVNFNEDCNFLHQDNYSNLFHFEDYFSFN